MGEPCQGTYSIERDNSADGRSSFGVDGKALSNPYVGDPFTSLNLFLVLILAASSIPALFNSLAMHVYSICMSGSLGRELAENRARTCMLGLRSLQESWPVSGWILKLFSEIMEKLKTKVGSTVTGGYNSPIHLTSRTRDPMRMQSTAGAAASTIFGLPTDDSAVTTPRSNLWASASSEYMLAQDHQILPNMFMLDNFSQDPSAEQMMFFDSLNVPDWDSVQNTQYR
jgi:hypothetical protein